MYLKEGLLLNNRYEIKGVLGQGGFGITYLATDQVLHLPVAIKEYLPRQLATRGENQSQVVVFTGQAGEHYTYGLKKFLDEARVLARFAQQPGIVSVRDYFEANNSAYMVMEFIEGQTLKDYLSQHGGKISWDSTLRIMFPVLEALEQVHAAGLLHRDVSPDNIFLTLNGQVKLLDFGAARYYAGEHSRSLSVILKPGYAPEEQYRSGGKQGAWTDVYAAAATMYRALTGTTPPESLDRMAEDTLMPPSRLGIAVPIAGEAALLKALTVPGSQRFQSMKAFREALTDINFDAPTQALPRTPAPAWTAPVPEAPPRSQRRGLAQILVPVGAVAVILLFVGSMVVFWGSGKTPSNQQGQIKERGATADSQSQPPDSRAAKTPSQLDQETVKNLKDEFLRFAGLGDELSKKGDFAQAIRNYNRAIELIPDFSDWIYNNRGLAYLQMGDFKTALVDFNYAVSLNPKAGVNYNNRAVAYHGLKDYQQAHNDLLHAQRLGHQINQDFFKKVAAGTSYQGLDGKKPGTAPPVPMHNPALAKALCEEGRQLYKQGNFAAAIEKLEASVQCDSGSSFAHYLLGWSYNQLERSPELALASFQAAVRLKPDYALAYDGLAWTYNKLGQYQEALQPGKKAVQLVYNFPDAHYNLGMAYVSLGNQDLAMKQHQILQKMNQEKADLLLRNMMPPENIQTGAAMAASSPVHNHIQDAEVHQFIRRYYQATAQGNLSNLLDFYSEYVNYYGKGRVNRSFVKQDKENYYRRWPMQAHELKSGVRISSIADDVKQVEFSTHFQVKNNEKQLSGIARNQWIVQKINGRMAIIDEKSQVVHRE